MSSNIHSFRTVITQSHSRSVIRDLRIVCMAVERIVPIPCVSDFATSLLTPCTKSKSTKVLSNFSKLSENEDLEVEVGDRKAHWTYS